MNTCLKLHKIFFFDSPVVKYDSETLQWVTRDEPRIDVAEIRTQRSLDRRRK